MKGLIAAAFAVAGAGCAAGGRAMDPSPAPADAEPLALASSFLDSMVAEGAAPGAVLAVSYHGRHSYHSAGHLGELDFTRPDSTTIYDMASLTKVIALTTLVEIAVDEHRLALDDFVSWYVPQFQGDGKDSVTIRHLLTHSSGLPAWRPLFREAHSREGALLLADTTALAQPPGVRFVYSDIGAIILAQIIERLYGQRLDSLFDRRIAGPVGLVDTRFLPPVAWWFRTAPTEFEPWRGRTLRGEVHDENASRLDGVSGHAGLFSSARDLLRMGDWLLQGWSGEPGAPGWRWPPPPAAGRSFAVAQHLPTTSSRALGWDTPSPGSSAGTLLSRSSFGHTGFTGTSFWVDPERGLVIVLLSNRVHPTRDNARWGPVRRGVADLVVEALGGARPALREPISSVTR